MQKIANKLYKANLRLDIETLRKSCLTVNKRLYANLLYRYESDTETSPPSTRAASEYNVLTFMYPEIHNLYRGIREKFLQFEKIYYGKNKELDYYCQAWINVYNKGQYADWHNHGGEKSFFFHGFVCVDTHYSHTTYIVGENHIDVESKDGQIVIASNAYKHRSHPWNDDSRPRITVAFDICEGSKIKWNRGNHWIPI